jgi:NAD(P)-dependent dehydrogenase (short-subunit alcohol dehydrogenase family)
MTTQKRNAVVFGAAQGIGFATCQLLAKDCDGLALIDIDKEAAQRAADKLAINGAKAKLLALGADITKTDAVAAARDEINKAWGASSILINSAAIVDDKLFLDSTPADWDRVLRVCLYGPMNILHEFLPSMAANRYGRVVCMASDSYKLGQARLSYYAAAKGGVVALVKSLAQELGRSGVNLNVVSPGATNTEMRRAREEKMLAEIGPEKYERRQKAVLKMYPLGRLGEPHDIAAAVHFLTTDNAAWITGQVLSVNGGFSMA